MAASEQIITEYILELGKLKAQINEIEAGFKSVAQKGKESQETVEKATKKTADTAKKASDEFVVAAQKRKEALEREIKALEALELRKKKAFDPNDIRTFNALIDNSKERIKLLGGQVEKTGQSVTSFNDKLKNIAGQIGLAFGVAAVVNFAKEAVDLSAKADGVQRAFDRLNRPDLLDQLRKATKGTVNDLELMAQAVKADKLGIPINQFATFLQFAQQRARETGESVDSLVDAIVNGIGRQSVRIIDNLGISQIRVREEFKKTGNFAVAVTKIINEELEKQGASGETTADKISQLSASFTNLQKNIGDVLIPILKPLINLFSDLFEGISGTITFIDQIIDSGFDFKLLAYSDNVKSLTKGVDDFTSKQQFDATIRKITDEIQKLDLATDAGKKRFALLNEQLVITGKAFEDFKKAASNAIPKSSIDSVEALKEKIKEKKEELEKSNITNGESLKISKEILKLEDQLKIALGEETDAQKEAKKQAKLAQEDKKKILDQELNDIKKSNEDKLTEQDKTIRTKLTNQLKEEADFQKTNAEISAKGEENILKKEQDDEKKSSEKIKKDKEELDEVLKESAIQGAQTIADARFEIESNNIEKEQERALETLAIQENTENSALDKKEEIELSRKNLTETQKKLIQDKYDKLRAETQKKFDQKELEVKKKAFEDNKSLSIKQAILNGALAITKILADVPKFDFGVATAILVGLAVAQTSAQIAVINAQKFAKGTDFVQRGNSPKGIDTIPAYVNEGEAIIPTDKNKKYHDYTKHMISGTLEDYINQNNVMPALQSYVAKSKEIERKSTAQAMADSIVLNNQINEYAMTRAVSKGGEGRSVNIANHKALAKSLANEMNKNNNFF